MRTVGDPQVSPDGKWIAYTVSTIDAGRDSRDTDLWMASWDATQQVRLTATPDSSESRPRWSPDNRYLAFLTSRGDEASRRTGPQVWLLDRAGGEAQRLTNIKGGVSDFEWSPDGKRLVLVVDDVDPASEPEMEEGWNRKTTPPIVIDRYHFKSDGGGYLTRLYSHLALWDMETGKAVTLTSGTFDDETPSWSPDGTRIAFVSNRTPDPDRNQDTNIYVIDAVAGATLRQLTTYSGSDDGRPAWSPDGKWLAYYQGEEAKFAAYGLQKLAVVPAAGGTPRVLTAALDRAVSGPILWSADGASLRVIVQDDRTTYVARIEAATGAAAPLTSGPRVVSEMSPKADGSLAVVMSTATDIGEVYALDNGAFRRITHQNDSWFDQLQLATTEGFSCRSKDGTVVSGLMVKPAGFVAGKRYPTLLWIHGGPNGQDAFSFSFERELFAASGYVVLAVNYRGGAGRGAAYQKAIAGDWGNKEVMDLLAGVDYAVASGVADPDRLGIGGWSYGGILTNYTIASDSRFKAAISGASSSLQLTMYGTDRYIEQYDNEMGPPWKNEAAWLKVSYPFFHADQIRTPTLFLCGQVDFNVPIAGVEQMYQALRGMNVDTQLVIYPGQHHAITMPSYVRDRLTRYLAWWNKHLGMP